MSSTTLLSDADARSREPRQYSQQRPRVLLLAYTCCPERGSEPGMGWNRAVEAAKHFDTWVLCQKEACEQQITAYLEKTGPVPGLRFEYLPESFLERCLKLIPWLAYFAFRLWNYRAGRVARRLHQSHQFDLVHHVTYSGFREPGYLWKLDVPFVWGPIGGAQNYPWRFLMKGGLSVVLQEGLRSIVNEAQIRFSVRVRRAVSRASLLLAATTTNSRVMSRIHGVAAVTFPDTGVRHLSAALPAPRDDKTLRLLWCGMLSARKALHLLIDALTQLPEDVSWKLRVVGTGPLRKKWERLAVAKGVNDRIEWLGSISHQEALTLFEWTDVFVFTSLRDTTGTVLLEALAAGVPVICLDHQGAADVVDGSCGIKIPVTNPAEVVARLAENIDLLGRDATLRETLGRGALRRAKKYLWSEQGSRLAEMYRQVIADWKGRNETAEDRRATSEWTGAVAPIQPSLLPQSCLSGEACLPALAPEPDELQPRADRAAPCRSGSGLWREWLGSLWGPSARTGFFGLVDQAIVSGTRFLTTVMIGRLCGAGELGTYTLAFSLMLAAMTTQDSLVLGPLVVYGNRLKGARRSAYAGSVLLEGIVLAVLAVCALLGVAVAFVATSAGSPLGRATGVLAAVVPFILLHQFGRRYAFAELDMRTALALDASAAVVQLGGLAILATIGLLSAPAMFGVVGLGCAVPGCVWFALKRRSFQLRWKECAADMRQNWRLGRWMLAAQLTSVLGMYVTGWLLAILLDTAAAGIYAACISIVCLSNPILLGLSNVFVPRAARAYAEGGPAKVRRVSHEAQLVLVGMTGTLGLGLLVFGRDILALLYGQDYAAYHHIISIAAIAAVFNAARMAADQGLSVLERSDLGFVAQFIGVGVTFVASLMLIPHWGVFGAALGPLAGQATSSVFVIVCHELIAQPAAAAGGES